MLTIFIAALCAAAVFAETSSVSGFTPVTGSLRDYQYASGSYLSGKPAYSELESASFITSGSSPYAKSDTRYLTESIGDGVERSGLASSFYKSKYASDSVANSLRPSSFVLNAGVSSPSSSQSGSASTSSSSSGSPTSSASSASSSSEQGSQQQQQQQVASEYSSPASSGDYSEATSSAAYATIYGEREQQQQQQGQVQQQGEQYSLSRPVYAGYQASSAQHGTTDYVYPRHAAPTYAHSTGSSSGLQSSPEYLTTSSGASGSTPGSSVSQQLHHYYPSGEAQPSYLPHYKTYVTSGGVGGSPSSGYPSYASYSSPKYQSVLGALKSLFGAGGPEPLVSSPSHHHASLYSSASSAPSSAYFASSPMAIQSHATAYPSSSHSSPGLMASASAPSSHGFYYTSGSSGSGSPYAKSSLPPMRFVSGYGVPSGMGSSGGKIILIRDSAGAHSSLYPSGYPATPSGFASAYAPGSAPSYPSSQLFSPSAASSAYMPKTKYAYASAAASMPSAYYAPSPSSSSMNYASGLPSSAYPGSYSSSASFPAHGGSPFLGYSA